MKTNNDLTSGAKKNSSIRFKLIAQNRHDELVVEILDQKLCMVRTVREIVNNIELLRRFSQEDVAVIESIACTEELEVG